MKYYRIDTSIDSKVVGTKYPQVKDGIRNFSIWDPNVIDNFFLKRIDIKPYVPELELWKVSKVTDLISSSTIGTNSELVISDKLKKIIEKYSGDRLQFFSTKIHQKGYIYDNYWISHLVYASDEFIDFAKSRVVEGTYTRIISNEKVAVDNFDDFLLKKSERVLPITLKITNYSMLNIAPDFFYLLYTGTFYHVSEKVKTEIEQAGCTGVTFNELYESSSEFQ